jgi:hypothetical protein
MAKVEKNIAMRGMAGKIGDLVFRQMRDGSTRVSAAPSFRGRKFSKGQKSHQSRFKEAAAYARDAAKSQPIYAELARGTTKNAYNIALSDWFNPPVIHHIARQAGRIWVEASDNVKVANVRVKILDKEDKVLEEGDALQVDEKRWEYATNVDGKVEAEARDLAGNKTKSVI